MKQARPQRDVFWSVSGVVGCLFLHSSAHGSLFTWEPWVCPPALPSGGGVWGCGLGLWSTVCNCRTNPIQRSNRYIRFLVWDLKPCSVATSSVVVLRPGLHLSSRVSLLRFQAPEWEQRGSFIDSQDINAECSIYIAYNNAKCFGSL